MSAFHTTRLSIDPRCYITDLGTKINSIGETTLELGSHADTCILDPDALILLDYDRPVIVEGYDLSLSTKTYATVSRALAYDDPVTGKVYHLAINQAIHIPHLDHHLLCPMQCQVNDLIVDNMPKFLTSDPTDHMHVLTIIDPHQPTQTVILRLALQGVTSLLNVRGIMLDEWSSDAFKQLHLSLETLTWDPSTTLYEEQEAANYSGCVVMTTRPLMGHINHLVINWLSSLTTDHADVADDENFYDVLASHVEVSSIETSLNGHIHLCKTAPIDPQTLAARWMISLERAKQTVIMTTQRGVRTCLNPTLSQQFPTNDQMLQCKCVLHTMFSDRLFAGSISRQGNKMAQMAASC